MKTERQKPSQLIQPLVIPEWKWDNIFMDVVVGLPNTVKGNSSIWVVMDLLTKSTHFFLIKINYHLQKLAEIYNSEIVKLHGTPSSVVLNRDSRFKSRFWESLQASLGTKLRLSFAYHPQTDYHI